MRIINYSIGLILLVLLVQSSAYGQFTFVPSRFQYDASPFCSSCNPEDGILHWYFDLDSIRIIDATESESAKFQITIQNRFSRTVSTSALNQRVEALSMAISSNIDAFADLENSCEVEFSSNFLSVSDGGRLNNSYSVIISNAFFGGNASAISINMLAADFFNLFRTPFVDRDQIVSVGARPQDTYTLICDIENTDQEAGFAFNASVVFEGSSFRLYTDPFSNAFDDVIQRPASQLADNDLRGFRLDGKTWAKDYARYGDGTGVRLRFSEGIQTQLNTQNFVVLDTSDAPLVIDGSTVTIASVEHIADESYANVVLSSAVSGGILRLVSTATNVVIDARGETLANDNFLASLEYDADAPRVIVVSEPISTLTTAEQQIVDADSSNNYSVRAITFSSPISVATIDEGDICVTATPNGSCVTGDTPAVANIDGGSEPMTTTIRVLINEGDGKTEISGGSLEFRRNAILGADYRVVEDYQQPLRGIIDIADTQPPVIAITGAEATADDNNLLLYTITFTVTADEPVPTLNDIDSYTLLRLLTDGSVTVEITPATQSISGNDRRAMLEYTYTFADEDALRNTAGFVLARSSDTTLVDTGGLSPEIGPNGGLDPSNDDAVAVERADTSLRNLVVSEGTLNPDFNSKTLSYTVSVANMTTMITVMPTASDADVISITVNGDAVDSDNASIAIDLTGGGTTTITVVVTAQDNTKSTYTIAVSRTPSTDVSLSALPSCTQTIPDIDDDSVPAAMDIDKDNNGLIELCSLEGLDAIRHQLDGSGYQASSSATPITTGCPDDGCFGYELVRSLDFEDTGSYDSGIINTAWTTGAGWQPIGSADNPFIGNFVANLANDADITISNLTINRPNADYVGLFSVISFNSSISGIRLLDADIKGRFLVGGIIGSTFSFSNLLANSSVQGSVEGSDAWVGGLVGLNYGAIINGYAEGSVKGHTSVGGLAGYSLGPISNSYASVDIEAKAYSGGLVGYNHHREDFNYGGRITNSYATGSVQSGFGVGGLVGYNSGGFINDVYASGPVVGSVNVGGLVGYNAANGRINGRIENGYALGVVSGGVSVGGLVGYSDSNAVIINSYWDSDVSGIDISAGGTSRTSVELLTNVELLSSASTTTVYANWSADNWDFGSQASLKYPTLKYRLGTDSYGNQICGADVSLPDCGTALPDQGQPGSLGQLALTTLTLSEGVLEPPFDPTQTYYEILDIPAEQTDVTIAATINNNQATITIDDMPLSGEVTISRNGIGSTLEDGIQIVLTAIDQSTQQYTIVLPTQPVLTGLATSPCREDDIDIDDDGLIEICDIEGLYAMRYQLDGSGYRPSSNANLVTTSCGGGDGNDTCNGYELMRDLDFNNPDHYRESRNQAIWTVADYGDMTDRGWRPIGHPTRPFNAIFTGNGYTISNLAINRDDSDYVGLFGNTASDAEIANVGLSDVTIQGRSLVGGLVGRNNESTIEHSYVSGDVLGHDILVGGLVGWHGGRINNSYVMGMVSGNREVGGLVGTSYSIDNNSTSTIINSYALSNVQGRTFVGGLIGLNVELTSNSYASGGVNGIITVGGLVGLNAGIIENSYASGSSSGDDFIGGLIGDNRVSVRTSYANGAVSGNRFVGGLIGINSGSIVDSYWDRETSGIGTSAGSPDANGLTTNQLQTSNLFDGWSSEQWDVAAGRYPALKYTAGDDNENPTCDNEVETDLPPCGIVLSAQIPGLLDSLTVFGGILTPQFDPQMPSYNVDASIDEIELRATAADSLITVRIDESAEASTNTNSISQTIPILDDRTTTITVVVTAQDGSRTETYTITVHPTTGIRVRVKVFLEGPLR